MISHNLIASSQYTGRLGSLSLLKHRSSYSVALAHCKVPENPIEQFVLLTLEEVARHYPR
jgi:hypothetical protein